jgi:hypothetical protein
MIVSGFGEGFVAEFLPGLSQISLPRMVRVRQRFDAARVNDVAATVRAEVLRMKAAVGFQSGQRVALAVGSRGIAQLPLIVKTLADALKELGLSVFIVPAMGSHGGATAEGQRAVLQGLGVTEESCGVAIRSSMETVVLGTATALQIENCKFQNANLNGEQHPSPRVRPNSGAHVGPLPQGERGNGSATQSAGGQAGMSAPLPVHVDAIAWREADWVVPVARVKPHTSFRARYESGICKMLAIGLAKHMGCAAIHREGYARFGELIPACANVVLKSGKIAFALGVVENALDEPALLEAVPAGKILEREPGMLELARSLLPRILIPEIDVLVVEEIGKDISGMGMDPNVTGRGTDGPLAGFSGPKISRIVVLGLSAGAHGNANGIGLADVITRRALEQIDRSATYTNVLTSGSLANAKIPLTLPTEREAILAAASCVPGVCAEDARVVRIKNTLQLGEIEVSENLLDDVRGIIACEVV